jgi:hypothetical protein
MMRDCTIMCNRSGEQVATIGFNEASLLGGMINVSAVGVEAAPGSENVRSFETYIGYRRAENFASAQPLAQDSRKVYTRGQDFP